MRNIYFVAALLLPALITLSFFACGKLADADHERYVVLSPEVAEILVAIGATERIAGITEECKVLPGLEQIAVVGKFGMLDREKIIALKPGIIFASALEQQSVAEDFGKLGYRVEIIYPKTIAEMLSEIVRLGDITDLQSAANELAASMRKELELVHAESIGLSRPRVYLEIYRDPLMSVSDQSFVGELIESAGGDNIFPTLERDYSRIKAEDVINAAPEIIICFSHDTLQNILSRKGWQRIPAIINRRVFFEEDINPDWIQRAGPRSVLGLRRLQEIISSVRDGLPTPPPAGQIHED